jgi:hypothetical protein
MCQRNLFSLSELHKLQTLGNEVLKKIFGPKLEEVSNLEKYTGESVAQLPQ